MVFGTFVYAAETGLSCYAACVGLGSPDSKHNEFFAVEGKKYFTIWILVYVHALATIKSSVCITILRIAGANNKMRIAIWVLLAITWASYFVTFIGDMLVCRPIEGSWDTALVLSGKATCAPMELMIGLSHTATGSTITTDLACAVLPGIVLWNAQMDKKSKFSAFVLLSFASVASIVTLIRAFYIGHYNHPEDNLLFWIGHIALFSNIEIGIGCVAGSVPTLRRLFLRNRSSDESLPKQPQPFHPRSLVTFGGTPINRFGMKTRDKFKAPSEVGFSLSTVNTRGEWEQLQDGDEERGMATANTSVDSMHAAEHTRVV
ncbi:hypothetical protein F4810DRAFT_645953 [Camillea tinctor]|nr:hypothetical protein F4810DRAFT_645953 [Camillea tinctor]